MLHRGITESDLEEMGRLFNSNQGRKVLEILDKKIYNTISFVPGESTELGIYKDGQRDLVHMIKVSVKMIGTED